MPRRGDNIYRRKDGRWEGRVRKRCPISETRKYKSIYGKTYKEVKSKIDEYRRQQPDTQESCPFHMAEAAEIWLREKRPCWKPTTYGTYRQVLDKYVIPYFGSMPLERITDRTLEQFRDEISSSENICLSNNYLFYICSLVQRIMSYINRKYDCTIRIPDTPVSRSRPYRNHLPGEYTLSVLESYLAENIGEDTCLGIAIALYTGIRIGELCALSWEDIDFREEVIRISRNIQRIRTSGGEKNKTEITLLTPKTTDSVRVIPIPPVLYSMLLEQRNRKTGFIISGTKNPWVDPRTLQYRFKKILLRCEIEYFNFHMLRHAFATRCIAIGFDMKSLSEILGHSSVQITLSLYVHSSIQQKKQLMSRFVSYTNL